MKITTEGCGTVLMNDAASAMLHAYDFALRRVGKLVALDIASEARESATQG